MNKPFRRIAWCAVALAGLFVASSAQAQSYRGPDRGSQSSLEGRYLDLSVIDRARGNALPVYPHRNRHYLAGEPGRPYRIQLTNTSHERIMAVVAVDGINVVNGQTASYDQVGYVLDPGQTANIDGWRKSMTRVAQFTFATLPETYAAQTGRADQVGVIGVAVFRERYRRPPPPSVAMQDKASESSAQGAARAPAASRSIGTGHGASQWSPVNTTTFERASSQPAEVVRLDYDRRSALVRRGIVRSHSSWDEPETFPGEFVPDPPRHR